MSKIHSPCASRTTDSPFCIIAGSTSCLNLIKENAAAADASQATMSAAGGHPLALLRHATAGLLHPLVIANAPFLFYRNLLCSLTTTN